MTLSKDHDFPVDPSPYLRSHDCETHFLTKADYLEVLEPLAQQGFDVFLNLCDGAADEDRPGLEVVLALERLNLPFTGAASHFFEPTREEMKAACGASGVLSPAFVHLRSAKEIEKAERLRFPLIVKHPNSYGSIGLTRSSRVETPAELRQQAKAMLEAYGGALVEEFVEGREFTVLVAENPDDAWRPTVYEPLEIVFPKGETFKHFDLKWVDYEGLADAPVADAELAEALKDASSKLFVGLGGTSYGRCDLRVNLSGEVFMLEINPNCGLFYAEDNPGSADLILQRSPGGHRAFLQQIIRAACKRHRQRPA